MRRAKPDICVNHPDRESYIIIGFDKRTGKLLSEDERYGLCEKCWENFIRKLRITTKDK